MDDVDNMPMVKNQDCIRLRMAPLASSVKQHARDWIKCFGNMLHESAKTGLYALTSELEVCASIFYITIIFMVNTGIYFNFNLMLYIHSVVFKC